MTDSRHGTFTELEGDEPYPGVRRRVLDADGCTVTEYTFEAGAEFPRHRHRQEQVTMIEHGAVTMTLGQEPHELSVGAWSVVGGGVEHGIVAGPDGARIRAVLVPRRGSADEIEVRG